MKKQWDTSMRLIDNVPRIKKGSAQFVSKENYQSTAHYHEIGQDPVK
jgi:hypothetical protein